MWPKVSNIAHTVIPNCCGDCLVQFASQWYVAAQHIVCSFRENIFLKCIYLSGACLGNFIPREKTAAISII